MAAQPPDRIPCDNGNCSYTTPAGIREISDMVKLLEIHARTAHPEGFVPAAAGTSLGKEEERNKRQLLRYFLNFQKKGKRKCCHCLGKEKYTLWLYVA